MSSKNGVLAFERTFSEKHLKNGVVIMSLRLPFSICHPYLVHIGQQGIHPIIADQMFSVYMLVFVLLHLAQIIFYLLIYK